MPENKSRENNNLGGRVRRYAQVSTAMSGIAARAAGERYLGMRFDKGRQASELREALGGLKGPLMKVAQILSTIPEALPEEYTRELAQLQADAPRMGWPFVRRRMKAELGADWPARFGTFDREATAAASLGQVHRATLPDGTRLACKLQYPDMASVVEADLRQLKWIISIYRSYDSAIDPSDIHAEIAERLREELDYAREARNMALYGHMLRDEPHVHIPTVVPEVSTQRLLTMSWMDGRRMLEFVDESPEVRNRIAYNMFRAWYVPFYEYGVIHGDPHLGNYTVRDDHSINLLDYGAIRIFPPRFVKGVIDLFFALRDNDHDRAVHAYECWGFENLSKDLIEVLNLWAEFIYAPLMEDRTRRIQETNSGRQGRNVAEGVHEKLKQVGGVKPPREFVLMDRAAIGLGSVFMHLKAEINWHQLFHNLIDDFNVDALAARQSDALAAAQLHLADEAPPRAADPKSA
ncbi:ABC1 kinase family protein [Roseospira visakhapatnamensis]|uniref:Putative unusual protein kinase regulating ubiquinone biosynthesis (AarF/ABC1/UbiB family) n=1 Tax=Roseospira visakhapatnamensis TaxID=390880 RepID=A0A7W6RAI9_9PROT|nr:AarF/ABC1/UbiB kinase family protein [Roseospira visakhapatnamensis]MBB4264953.1 putative unusual protein kinase regulating ubiquinone biosynthesis (AarF/ABC1/UbiB family) [Roseospira visakhapatnamensis]